MIVPELKNLKGEILTHPRIVNAFLDEFNKPLKFEFPGISLKRLELKAMNLSILFALARLHKIGFVSIGAKDLITGNIIDKKVDTFSKIFSWEVCRAMGFDGSCGNGLSDYASQYQINGEKRFLATDFGVWDPKTETQVLKRPFTLYMPRAKVNEFGKAAHEGNILDIAREPYYANEEYKIHEKRF